MTQQIGEAIGNYVGRLMEMDPNNFKGSFHPYMGLCVCLNIHKPLKAKK